MLDLEWFNSDFERYQVTPREFCLDKFQTQFTVFDNSFLNKTLRKLGLKQNC